jgi:hypothetical protein
MSQIWRDIISVSSASYDAVHIGAIKILPFAPPITPCVAVVGGAIALYSIHVTRSIARKRATRFFFLRRKQTVLS